VEGVGRGLIFIVSSRYLPGWAKENHEELHSGNSLRDSNQTPPGYKLEAFTYESTCLGSLLRSGNKLL
jgi:hypothetical protein